MRISWSWIFLAESGQHKLQFNSKKILGIQLQLEIDVQTISHRMDRFKIVQRSPLESVRRRKPQILEDEEAL